MSACNLASCKTKRRARQMYKSQVEKRKCFFECVVREQQLPLSYCIEHGFGLCSHKGNGREFTAHIFERVAAVVKIVIDN